MAMFLKVGVASSFDSNYAVLVYSNNTKNGIPNNADSAQYDMYPTNQNGPNGWRTTTNVTNSNANYSVRPVIEIKKTNINLD